MAVKLILFNLVSPKVNISLPIFIYENKLFMFQNVFITSIADIWLRLKTMILKNTNSDRYHTLLMHLFY